MPPLMASSSMLAWLAFALASVSQSSAGPLNARRETSSGSEAVATVTGYAHPLKLEGLDTLAASQTPLSYESPPRAIPVPTAPSALAAADVAEEQQQEEEEERPSPAAEAEAASACTLIAGSSPTATIPSFCEPSLHVNAPNLLLERTNGSSSSSALPLANVTVATTADKIGCCAECARYFNCVAWRFVPVYAGEPTDKLPGGFDPWGRGSCEVVYHTGGIDAGRGVTADGAADLCPNGRVGELLEGSSNAPGPGGETDRWLNVYYNGWNQGACGQPRNVFQSVTNDGMGDPDTLC